MITLYVVYEDPNAIHPPDFFECTEFELIHETQLLRVYNEFPKAPYKRISAILNFDFIIKMEVKYEGT